MKSKSKILKFQIVIFCYIMFMLGFENAGYQITIVKISQFYNVNEIIKSLLISIQFIAILLGPILFMRLSYKIGQKKMLKLFAVVYATGSLLCALSNNVFIFGIAIFIVGIAYAMLNSQLVAVIMTSFPLSNTRKNSISQALFSVGAVISPLFISLLNGINNDWRIIFLVNFIFGIIAFVLIRFLDPKPHEMVVNTSVKIDKERHVKATIIILIPIALMALIYVGSENGIAFFMDSFVNLELGNARVSAICVSAFWGMMIFSRILAGVFHKKRYLLLFIALVGIALFSVFLSRSSSSSEALIYSFILGFFAGPVYPLIASLATENSNGNTVLASSMTMMFAGIGGSVVPLMFGYVKTASGTYANSFLIIPVLVCIALVAYIYFIIKKYKRSNNR